MNIGAVMDDLAAALETIQGLRVSPYWADRITPPAAIVEFPDEITYDTTMGRGSDRMSLIVRLCVARGDARTSRDQLARYAAGSGDYSAKAAIESRQATAYDVATVNRAEFGVLQIAGVEYLATTLYIDITGKGA